jgi:hypothetical protein
MVCPHCGLSYDDQMNMCPACGRTPAAAAAPAPVLPREKGWWERNWKWAVPAFVIVSVGVLVWAVFGFVTEAFRSSYAYQEALARARANPAVVEQLGTPIEPGRFVSGSISVSGARGEADLAIPVSGPKGRGTLYARASRRAGEWRFSMLLFAPESGPRIDLLKEQSIEEPQRF